MYTTEVTVPVTWGDVDPAQIIFHPQYFYWFDYACQEWLKSIGRHPKHVAEERGVYMLIVEANAQFRSPAYLDDRLRIVVGLGAITGKIFTLEIKVYRIGDDKLLAEGFQKRAYVRYHADGTKKAEPIPPDFFPQHCLPQ